MKKIYKKTNKQYIYKKTRKEIGTSKNQKIKILMNK